MKIYYCKKYFSNVSKFNRHVICCSEIAGIVYKFEHKNIVLVTFNRIILVT